MAYINNAPIKEVFELKNLVETQVNSVSAQILVNNPAVGMRVLALEKGQQIATHSSKGDAMVTVLEGTGKFTVEDTEYICNAGETLIMPAGKPHSVFAQENFKMLLTVIFPESN